jgi:site-specific recombinase XerD
MTTALAINSPTLERIESELRRDPRIKSERSFDGYRRDLARFESWRAGRDMTKLLVEEYARALQNDSRSVNTINRALAAIRWWARRLSDLAFESSLPREQRDVISEQTARVMLVRDVRGEVLEAGRYIPASEFDALLSVCFNARKKSGGRSARGVRDAAILTLAWVTGMRLGEIVGLDLSDIDRSVGKWRVTIRHGKGDKQRRMMLADLCKRRLREWLSVRGLADGALFCPVGKGDKVRLGKHLTDDGIAKMLVERARAAGLAKTVTWHDFRRTFASNLLDKGVDIVTVQKLMGHASPTTTSRYDRRGERTQDMALENLP